MKIKLLILVGFFGLLSGCGSYYGCRCDSCGCTNVTYQSQCGAPTCTYNPLDLDDP